MYKEKKFLKKKIGIVFLYGLVHVGFPLNSLNTISFRDSL